MKLDSHGGDELIISSGVRETSRTRIAAYRIWQLEIAIGDRLPKQLGKSQNCLPPTSIHQKLGEPVLSGARLTTRVAEAKDAEKAAVHGTCAVFA